MILKNNLNSVPLLLVLFFLSSISLLSAQVGPTWTGTVSNAWGTAGNWSTGTVPALGDTVLIPSSPTGTNGFPVLSTTSAPVISVTVESGASLDIASSGVLNLAGEDSNLGYGIGVFGGTVTNMGTINSDSSTDGIKLEGSGSLFTNAQGANISILNNGSDPIIMEDTSLFNNHGTIIATLFDNDGICTNDNSVFTNESTGTVTITDAGGELLELDAALVNHGTMNLVENSAHTDGADGLCLRDEGSFQNTGTLNISGVKDGESMEIDGPFTNEGTINISHGVSTNEAIEIENDGVAINTVCGIINVTSADSIVLESSTSSFLNQGIYTTVFTGENVNSGSFTNDGEIRTSTGAFLLTSGSNALTGSGTITTGPIPASSPLPACSNANLVPTLSEWGLILFALLVLAGGVVAIWRKSNSAQTTV